MACGAQHTHTHKHKPTNKKLNRISKNRLPFQFGEWAAAVLSFYFWVNFVSFWRAHRRTHFSLLMTFFFCLLSSASDDDVVVFTLILFILHIENIVAERSCYKNVVHVTTYNLAVSLLYINLHTAMVYRSVRIRNICMSVCVLDL